jgi:hypothetical protein
MWSKLSKLVGVLMKSPSHLARTTKRMIAVSVPVAGNSFHPDRPPVWLCRIDNRQVWLWWIDNRQTCLILQPPTVQPWSS